MIEKQLTELEMTARSLAERIEADWVKGTYRSFQQFISKKDESLASIMSNLLNEQLIDRFPSFKISYSYDNAEDYNASYGVKPGYAFRAELTHTPGVFSIIAVQKMPSLLADAGQQLLERRKATVILENENIGLGEDLAQLLKDKLVLQYPTIHVEHQWSEREDHNMGVSPAKSKFKLTIK